MPIAQQGLDGLASCPDPCVPNGSQKTKASKTKEKRIAVSLFHAKSSTRIACWNVHTLGSLSQQSLPLMSALRTMKEKNIEVLAVSVSRGLVMESLKLAPTPFFTHVAIILSPRAAASWEAAGSVFLPISERIIRIRVKTHLGYATIIAVYAPVNPPNGTSEARAPSDAFYEQLHSTLASAPSRDMTLILGDFNARVGSRTSQWQSVTGPYGPDEVNTNGERLLDFCANNNSWYRNGDCSQPGHMIDLVLINRKFRSSMLDTRVFHATHLQSDHELVIYMHTSSDLLAPNGVGLFPRPTGCQMGGLARPTPDNPGVSGCWAPWP